MNLRLDDLFLRYAEKTALQGLAVTCLRLVGTRPPDAMPCAHVWKTRMSSFTLGR